MRIPGRLLSALSVLTLGAVGAVGVSAPAAAASVSAVDDPGAVIAVDNGTFTRDLQVATTGVVNEAEITVTFWNNEWCTGPADYHFAEDIGLALISPAGTRVTLVKRYTYLSGWAGDVATVVFDDQADSGVLMDSEGSPLSGTFRPYSPLSAVKNEQAAGTWVLEVSDGWDWGETCYYGASLDLDVTTVPVLDGTLDGAEVGVAYDQGISLVPASNAASSYSLASGELPPGLTLDQATGRISGEPRVGGLYDFTVTASNAMGASEPFAYSITVDEAPFLWLPGAVPMTAGAPMSVTPMFAPGYPAATVVLVDGELPDGVTLDAATGTLAGVATVAGDYPMTLEASNGVGVPVQVPVILTVAPAAVAALELTPSVSALDETGSADFIYAAQDAYGNAVALHADDVTLASDGADDVVDGDRVTFHGGGVHQVTATHVATGVSDTVEIAVAGYVPAALTGAAAASVVAGGEFMYVPVLDAGYPATGTVSLAEGVMPDGLTLDPVTGVISGTATVAGEHALVLEASNGVGAPARLGVTVTIAPDALASLTLTPSSTAPDQGDTITFVPTGMDRHGNSVTIDEGDLLLTSSVATDVIDGLAVTFPHASPHVITATHVATGVFATVTVEVTPMPVADTVGQDDAVNEDDAVEEEALPESTASAEPAAEELGDTGVNPATWTLTAAASFLLLAGGATLLARRRIRL